MRQRSIDNLARLTVVFLLFAFMPTLAWGQIAAPASKDSAAHPAEPVAKKPVPETHLSARATMRTFREAIQAGKTTEAAQCLDLSGFPVPVRNEKGAEIATLLNEAIGRTGQINLENISDDPKSEPYFFRSDSFGTISIARQPEGSDLAGQWLFTKATVSGAESLYEALVSAGGVVWDQEAKDAAPFNLALWIRENVPEPLKGSWFLLKHWQWLGLVTLTLLGLVIRFTIVFILRLVSLIWMRRRHVSVERSVQEGTYRPVGILAAAAMWWLGLTWLGIPTDVLAVLLPAVKLIACGAAVWTLYRTADWLGELAASMAAETETKIDDMLIPMARKVVKVLVTIFGIVFVVEQFTDEAPFKLLAGLGLGGLALALAAQDTLKNLFGSLTVVADRPFQVGDWVVIDDVEGTVESVGFRSTRIRTFYNSRITVPNARLMSATIDNFGARQYRRVRIMLAVTYSTPPEKIEAFCEGIRELIRLHPYTRKDYYQVYLNQFAAASLDILLYMFFEVPDWNTELRERHRFFLDILRLADRLGVDFAFPTQTIMLQRSSATDANTPTGAVLSGLADADAAGLREASNLFHEVYGPSPKPSGPVVIGRSPRSNRT